MKPFRITVLGSGSATPSKYRNPSSQVINIHEKLLLFDCGEGTQMQMRKYQIKLNRIHYICISHLHGDHYLGLMGLLFTMHLFGRKCELHIFAPSELKDIIDLQLKVSDSKLSFPLYFHPLESEGKKLILDSSTFMVYSFPLKHSIPTWGFQLREKECGLKINKIFIQQQQPSIQDIQNIKKGSDYINDKGELFKNSEITLKADILRSYSYCSDTLFDKSMVEHIKNTDILYHEATFLNDMADNAKEKFHSTAAEAAIIAKMANVKTLLIGHFSARYDETQSLKEEAMKFFENTIIAEDGLTIEM